MKMFVIAALAALSASVSAAATVTADRMTPTEGPVAAPTSNSTNFRLNFTGTDLDLVTPNSRSPWEEFTDGGVNSLAKKGRYNSVEKNGFAIYEFSRNQSGLNLMWGSPDDYNLLTFSLDGVDVFNISGDNSVLTAVPGFEAKKKFVNVHISDLIFDRIKFESTGQDAFEFSALQTTPVPLPAAGWLLLAGLGALAAVRRVERA